jgi:tryptophan synthase alpha chain
MTDLPVCLGFGVSTADDVRKISAYADGVVIGSAFEKIIEANLTADNLPEMLAEKTAEFKAATM